MTGEKENLEYVAAYLESYLEDKAYSEKKDDDQLEKLLGDVRSFIAKSSDNQIITSQLRPMKKESFPLDKPFLGVHSLTNKGIYQFHRLYYSSFTKKLVDESGRVPSQHTYLGWIPMLIYKPKEKS